MVFLENPQLSFGKTCLLFETCLCPSIALACYCRLPSPNGVRGALGLEQEPALLDSCSPRQVAAEYGLADPGRVELQSGPRRNAEPCQCDLFRHPNPEQEPLAVCKPERSS